MPVIDHFRHSVRVLSSEHVSRGGVTLARRVGNSLPEYDLVVTSEIPRAIETAIAMGYGVDRYESMLGSIMLAYEEADWEQGCFAFAEAAKSGGKTLHATQCHADLLRSIAASLSDHGRALVVSHGGVIELGVVGLLPEYDFKSWGPACERCEGVRLTFDGTECVDAQRLRISDLVAMP